MAVVRLARKSEQAGKEKMMERREAYRFAKSVSGVLMLFEGKMKNLHPNIPGVGEMPAHYAYVAGEVASRGRDWVYLDISPKDLGEYRDYLRKAVKAITEAVDAVDRPNLHRDSLLCDRKLQRRMSWIVEAFLHAPFKKDRAAIFRAAEDMNKVEFVNWGVTARYSLIMADLK